MTKRSHLRENRTYLGRPVLRGALGVGQLALPPLAAVDAVVAAGVGPAGHHAARAAADGRVDVLVVRAGAGAAGDVAIAVWRVVRGTDNGGELRS